MVLMSFVSYGQVKKTTTPKPSIQTLASEWFKKKHVDVTFKDPYSYKLLKVSVHPVSNDEYVTNRYMSTLDSVVTRDSSDIVFKPDSSIYNLYQNQYNSYNKDYTNYSKSYEEAKLKKSSLIDYYEKMMKLYDPSEYVTKMENEKQRWVKQKEEHDVKVNELKKEWESQDKRYNILKKEMESLTDKDKKHIVYNKIYIDCYGNNSYGNPILGRYSFDYFQLTNNGYNVIKLND